MTTFTAYLIIRINASSPPEDMIICVDKPGLKLSQHRNTTSSAMVVTISGYLNPHPHAGNTVPRAPLVKLSQPRFSIWTAMRVAFVTKLSRHRLFPKSSHARILKVIATTLRFLWSIRVPCIIDNRDPRRYPLLKSSVLWIAMCLMIATALTCWRPHVAGIPRSRLHRNNVRCSTTPHLLPKCSIARESFFLCYAHKSDSASHSLSFNPSEQSAGAMADEVIPPLFEDEFEIFSDDPTSDVPHNTKKKSDDSSRSSELSVMRPELQDSALMKYYEGLPMLRLMNANHLCIKLTLNRQTRGIDSVCLVSCRR